MFSHQVESFFFDRAFILQRQSTRRAERGHFFLSWTLSTGSRVCFLIDLISDIATLPFALLAVIFCKAFSLRGPEDAYTGILKEKTLHAGHSFIGATLSPWLVVEKIGTN